MHWTADYSKIKEARKKEKSVTKTLGKYNFTPQTSKYLAGFLIGISMEDNRRKEEIIGLLSRIIRGETK